MPLATSDTKIRSLGLYPGKSMRFESDVEELEFDADGLFGDREIMLVEGPTSEKPGTLISQCKDSN